MRTRKKKLSEGNKTEKKKNKKNDSNWSKREREEEKRLRKRWKRKEVKKGKTTGDVTVEINDRTENLRLGLEAEIILQKKMRFLV